MILFYLLSMRPTQLSRPNRNAFLQLFTLIFHFTPKQQYFFVNLNLFKINSINPFYKFDFEDVYEPSSSSTLYLLECMSEEIGIQTFIVLLELQVGKMSRDSYNNSYKSMKTIPSNKINQTIQKQVEELMNLLKCDSDAPYQLSFNPFSGPSCSVKTDCWYNNSTALQDLSVAQAQPQVASQGKNMEREEVPLLQEEFVTTVLISKNCLQKNQGSQLSDKKIKKRKQIKKAQKTSQKTKNTKNTKKIKKTLEIIPQASMEQQEELPIFEEAQATTAPDQRIRDHNNPKAYNKLVKNLLKQKNLGHLIEKYKKKFFTRYYFLVALIMIKFYVNKNFTQEYSKMMEKEVQVQQKKINRKSEEKGKIEKRIQQRQASRGNTFELEAKKLQLEKQISHIEVVIYEIKEFSMRSCAAFFQGDIEESLKILYLKDDPVMRKRNQFEQGLKIVKELYAQVRKTSSRHS